ncbi:MAG: M42 family metallopeptidase, partial [Ruminococcaceae bacterium]|nr:M42 family metallopeptidase [Oscillospiraceae bacterium]
MIAMQYADFAWEKTAQLLAIDSPTGFTNKAAAWLKAQFAELGYDAFLTEKGGVMVHLGGEGINGLMLAAHTDTLGAMVAEVKGNGRLRLTALGGMNANNAETENVRVYTRSGNIIEGTFQLSNASIHVNGDYNSTSRNY